MKQQTIVKIDGLSKKYGKQFAVDQLSLEIKEGEIFGLLGPNGAGKSTTMNMICSIVKPTFGTIEIFGLDSKTKMKEIKNQIGYVPQDLAIYEDLKAWENVELFTALYNVKGSNLKEAINSSLEFVGLSEKRNTFAKHFSGGMKRRLNIACAIGHNPRLLIFDEPTVGIDPQSRNYILNKIQKINSLGATVIYTSHYMEEIEAICTRIAIMDEGRIIAIGTKQELVEMVSSASNKDMSLEEVFLLLTGKSLRDQQ